MIDLQTYVDLQDSEEEKQIVRNQWDSATTGNIIQCGCCFRTRALTHAFRCLYCGVWFCFTCAEEHFGVTFVEHWEKENE